MENSASIEALRWAAAGLTILAAILVSWGASARQMVLGFCLFSGASLAWIAAGLVQGLRALTLQNAVLLAINVLGIWRWSGKARAEGAEHADGDAG